MRYILTLIVVVLGVLCGARSLAQTSAQRLVVVPSGASSPYVGGAGLASAITAANGMSGPVAIIVYAGSYTVSTTGGLPAITKGDGLTIEGDGRGTNITVTCTSGTGAGRLFTLQGSYIDIRNLTIGYDASCATYSDVPFGVLSGNDVHVSNILLASPPGLTVLGGASTSVARVTFRDISGPNWKSNLGLTAISVLAAQESIFDNVLLFGGNACTSTTRGVSITPTGITDTIILRRVETFTSAGCPRVFTIDFSNANLANVWVDNSVFDFSTVHSIEIITSGTNSTFAGGLRFSNTSFNAQAGGNSVYISLRNASTLLETVKFEHNTFTARGSPVIVLDSLSTGVARNLKFDGNDISFATTGWSGAGNAVLLGMDNFIFIGNNNTPADNGTPVSHPGSVFFKTTKNVANGIIQGNYSSIASTTLDTSSGTLTPSAVSGNIP